MDDLMTAGLLAHVDVKDQSALRQGQGGLSIDVIGSTSNIATHEGGCYSYRVADIGA